MDRNKNQDKNKIFLKVALHPEGVDRNSRDVAEIVLVCVSPSTRRAWIEIQRARSTLISSTVALHPEGVDRNP